MPHSYLPGILTLTPGSRGDYRALARFHYLPGHPATFAAIVAARYRDSSSSASRTVGVAVLSWPVACARGREIYFGLSGLPLAEKLRFANANLRTISRVIVHPQFRGIGLAGDLVRCLFDQCPTAHIEAMARMGRAHPFFEAAGMERVETGEGRPVYFVRQLRRS